MLTNMKVLIIRHVYTELTRIRILYRDITCVYKNTHVIIV